MLLGSNEYDCNSDGDTTDDSDFVRPKQKHSSGKPDNKTVRSKKKHSKAEEIKQDARLLTKLDGIEKRARNDAKYKNRAVSSANKRKTFKEMKTNEIMETPPPTNKITNYTSTVSTSTPSTLTSSSSSNVSIVASTSESLCGYHINPIFTSGISTKDLLKQNIYTQRDPNELCRGCNSVPSECANRTYRDICFHAVLDYYDKVGFHFTEDGIKKAYMNAYLVAARIDMCRLTSFYELSDELVLPRCMEIGSLRQSVEMLNGNRRFSQLMKQRVHNVQGHIKNNDQKIKDEIDTFVNSD